MGKTKILTMNVTKQQITGLVGANLLIVGLFLPIVEIPLLGNRNFFEVENFNGALDYSLTGIAYGILGLALASNILVLLNYCRGLLITSLIAMGVFALVLKQLKDLSERIHENTVASILMNITGTTVDENNLRWGWAVLLFSVLLLITASFLKAQPKEGIQ